MNDNYENNSFENKQENYDSYHFSTPIDPAPIEPEFDEAAEREPEVVEPELLESEQICDPQTEPVRIDSTYAYSFRKAEPKKPEMPKLPEKKKKQSSGTFKKFALCVALALVFGLVAGGVIVGVTAAGVNILGLNEKEIVQVPQIQKVETAAPAENATEDVAAKPTSTGGELTVAQVAERCMPAMVAITNTSVTEISNFFGFGAQTYEDVSNGSGIIIDQNENELLIATNNHVVSGANTLTVAFVDGSLVEATTKGTDADNDLAVVAVKITDISAETLEQIKVIQIGDSDSLVVGDQVVAIGNALGYGQSVSSGWVSALDREMTIENVTLTLLQTDAAINPGNSGGALLNMKGELIGINESKYADTLVEGMGYAIPVSTATPILSELMSKETRYKVDSDQACYVGITCKDINAEFAAMYGVPVGVYIDSVEEDGPAQKAGIQKGDIITEFDGTNLSSYTDLISELEYYATGEIVEVTVARADNGTYKELELLITLGSRKETDFLKKNE